MKQTKSTIHSQYEGQFINPFSDYGFKRIFGTELSKELIIEFLNSLIPDAGIEDLTFCNVEQLGLTEDSRRATFDILCRNTKQEYFLVEMQRKSQRHFQDRFLFYTAFLVQRQMTETQKELRELQRKVKEGTMPPPENLSWDWFYRMKRVYVISFLDYQMDRQYPDKYRWDVVRMDTEHHVRFGDVLHEIYLEMPKFQLPLSQCDTIHKKLLYVLTHMDILNRMPQELNNQIFQKLKHIASMSRMSPDEMLAYQMSLMNDYAYMDSLHTEREEGIRIGEERGRKEGRTEGLAEGRAEGLAEGRTEGKTEMAAEMKRRGMDWVIIAEISGLSLEEVKAL